MATVASEIGHESGVQGIELSERRLSCGSAINLLSQRPNACPLPLTLIQRKMRSPSGLIGVRVGASCSSIMVPPLVITCENAGKFPALSSLFHCPHCACGRRWKDEHHKRCY